MKKPTPNFFRKAFYFFLFQLLIIDVHSQMTSEASLVFVSCKSGTLYIDGVLLGQVEKDDAIKHNLSYGEHYVQLKSENNKINLTINVDQKNKEVIKLGCENVQVSQNRRLIDKQIVLSGPIVNEQDENVVGLDKGDKIVLNCSVLNRKGNASISIKECNMDIEIFRKERFGDIINEEINVPVKGVYKITAYTDALFGKEVKLTIDRFPSMESNPSFNTVPIKTYDTSSVEVLNTITRVYSVENLSHPNRTTISLNLPRNTTYWVYWIGVDQEAQEKMKKFAASIANIGSFLSSDPLIKYGMKLIPELPMLNSTGTVSYRFLDTNNGQSFINNRAYNYYKFKHADNISTDYSLINSYTSDLVLAMNNESSYNGKDVQVKVVAFSVVSRWELQN